MDAGFRANDESDHYREEGSMERETPTYFGGV
jgi:hypothetical protein